MKKKKQQRYNGKKYKSLNILPKETHLLGAPNILYTHYSINQKIFPFFFLVLANDGFQADRFLIQLI